MGSLSQFEEYANPLLWAYLTAGHGVGSVGFLKAVENADYFLHNLILLWLLDCCVAKRLSSRERRSADGGYRWADVTWPPAALAEIFEESFEKGVLRLGRFRGFHQ